MGSAKQFLTTLCGFVVWVGMGARGAKSLASFCAAKGVSALIKRAAAVATGWRTAGGGGFFGLAADRWGGQVLGDMLITTGGASDGFFGRLCLVVIIAFEPFFEGMAFFAAKRIDNHDLSPLTRQV